MLTAGNQKYKPMAWKERCNFGWHRKEWHIRNFLGREGKVSVGRVKYGAWGPALTRSSGGMYVVGGAGVGAVAATGRGGSVRTCATDGFLLPCSLERHSRKFWGTGGGRNRVLGFQEVEAGVWIGRRMACRRRTDLPLAAMEISASER